jgi:hypothetical protein
MRLAGIPFGNYDTKTCHDKLLHKCVHGCVKIKFAKWVPQIWFNIVHGYISKWVPQGPEL